MTTSARVRRSGGRAFVPTTALASSVEFTITFTPDGVGGTDYNISGEIQKG